AARKPFMRPAEDRTPFLKPREKRCTSPAMILRCDYLFPCHLANALHQPFRSQGLAPNGSGYHRVRKRPLLNGTAQARERPEGTASPPTEGRPGAGEGRDHGGRAEVGLLLTAGLLLAGLEGTATVGVIAARG